jgi:choline kinase
MKNQPKHVVPIHREKEVEVSVIILGGNAGYKMRTCGSSSLIKIKDKMLIEYQIDVLKQKFVNPDIILVTGFDSDKVIKNRPSTVRIVENQLEGTNEVEQLRLALNNVINDAILVIGGDILFDFRTLTYLDLNITCLVGERLNMMPSNSVGLTIDSSKATMMGHGIQPKWCHISYFRDKELKILKQLCSDRSKNKMFLFEIINTILDKTPIKVVEPQGSKIIKINNENINR